MRRSNSRIVFVGIVMLLLCPPTLALAQVSDPLQYHLFPGSGLEYGCFGPCACPVLISGPLKGDFTFYRPGLDPLSQHYELLNIAWTYSINDPATGSPRLVHVTGHGAYDLASSPTPVQRMTLDLISYDVIEQHFDSGWVPAPPIFPAIQIDVHRMSGACLDSIFHILASPFDVASVVPDPKSRLIHSAMPNPSSSDVSVLLALSYSAHVRVDVLDVRGRLVATLADCDFAPGEQRVRWSGRDARGGDAGSGVFWIRAQAGSQSDRQRIVRLR